MGSKQAVKFLKAIDTLGARVRVIITSCGRAIRPS